MSAGPRTTAELVVDRLVAGGMRTVFALPGVQNDVLFDALAREPRIRVIHTRHEQGAAYMALGAAMATGEPAAFVVVPGPGVLNTAAALSTAYACNAPMLCLTGQIPSAMIGKGYGFLHEIPDQLGILERLTKWSARIETPQEAGAVLEQAFAQLSTGRARPVAIECPLDYWPKPASTESRPADSPRELDLDRPLAEAAALLDGAERPMILVGSGAQAASHAVAALSERLSAPVVAHRMGHGVVDGRDALSLNVVAGHRLWPDVDLALAIGTRTQLQHMQWGVDPALKMVRIEVDPDEMNRFGAPSVGLQGAAEAIAPALLAALGPARDRQSWRDRIAEVKSAAGSDLQRLEPQLSFLAAIRRALPENGVLVDELTQLGYVARLAFPVAHPRGFLSPGYQGTLGWGVATGLGAKAARPSDPVVVITGDGGFMFNVQELATAVQHGLNIVVVVVNDGAFGNVERTQVEDFDGRRIASRLQNPDFLKLAESFGMRGHRAATPEDLEHALRQAFARDGPTLIEVPAGPMPSPWSFLRFAKVRGA